MANSKIDFKTWAEQLEAVWDLETEEDCEAFADLMYALTGSEDMVFAEKLLAAIRLEDDNGVYESLYNALWVFPTDRVGQLLAKRLPELQRRMGKYDQVSRFYIPIENDGLARQSFVQEAANWSPTDRKLAIATLKKWMVDSESWEAVLAKLGNSVKVEAEDPIPVEWPEEWKQRLKKGREKGGEYGISSDMLWKGSKQKWLDDLDFLFELLAMNHGKNWRQVDTMTNPLWFFAKTTVYPVFVARLASLPQDKQEKILKNIKRSNAGKYKQLIKDIASKK